MRRFLKSILMILFPAIVLPIIWIPSQIDSFSRFDITVDTDEGNPEIVGSLSFSGYISAFSEMNGIYEEEYFAFQNGEMETQEQPFEIEDPWIEELIEQYPSFIRGKMRDSSVNFNETDSTIFYAGMEIETYYDDYSQGEIRFAVFDKETGDESSYLLENPMTEVQTSYTDSTLLNNSTVYLFSTSFHQRAEYEEELIVYAIDPDTVEEGVHDSLNITREVTRLSDDDTIFFIDFENDPEQDNPYMILSTTTRDGDHGDYFLLDLNTLEIVEMDLNDQLENAYLLIDEDEIYALDNVGENQLIVYSVDLENNELTERSSIDVSNSIIEQIDDSSSWFDANPSIQENWLVLYEFSSYGDAAYPRIQLYDIETGESVFSGHITASDSESAAALLEVSIFDLTVDRQ